MGKDKKLNSSGGNKHKSKQSRNGKNPKKALKPTSANQKHQQINDKNTSTNNSSINISSGGNNITNVPSNTQTTNTTKKGLSALQTKFAKKLQGSRFRIINESIYTKPGADSFTG